MTFCAATEAPGNVVISTDATQNMSCMRGVCAPRAADAVLNASDLENLLGAGNVTVTTTGSGGVQANDVAVGAALSWPSTAVLSLVAHRSIAIGAAISVTGVGGMSLTNNDGGRHGTITFGSGGSIAFANLSSQLAIHGIPFTLVNTVTKLASGFAQNPSGKFALAANYDAGGDGTYDDSPVLTPVSGTFEGLGNTISNIKIVGVGTDKTVGGLFADIQTGASVKDLILANVNLTYTERNRFHGIFVGGLLGLNEGHLFGDRILQGVVHATSAGEVGGLAGVNDGTIASSSVNATTSIGNTYVGGIVGDNEGSIITSYATGSVQGDRHLCGGGLVSFNTGTITNSYATASISDSQGDRQAVPSAGGFACKNEGSIDDSYSTGSVVIENDPSVGGFACSSGSSVTNDYWDTTTSGTSSGTCYGNVNGVAALTDQQLRSNLPGGFDPTIWAQNPNINGGYPYLIANPPQ